MKLLVNKKMNEREMMVYSILSEIDQENSTEDGVEVSISEIQRLYLCEVSCRQIRRAIYSLESKGFLKIDQSSGNKNIYYLVRDHQLSRETIQSIQFPKSDLVINRNLTAEEILILSQIRAFYKRKGIMPSAGDIYLNCLFPADVNHIDSILFALIRKNLLDYDSEHTLYQLNPEKVKTSSFEEMCTGGI